MADSYQLPLRNTQVKFNYLGRKLFTEIRNAQALNACINAITLTARVLTNLNFLLFDEIAYKPS